MGEGGSELDLTSGAWAAGKSNPKNRGGRPIDRRRARGGGFIGRSSGARARTSTSTSRSVLHHRRRPPSRTTRASRARAEVGGGMQKSTLEAVPVP
eukprot:31387-Pelagococcus_subviridis.AAC.24